MTDDPSECGVDRFEAYRFYIDFFKMNGIIGSDSIDSDYCMICARIMLDCFMWMIKEKEARTYLHSDNSFNRT